MFEALVSPPAKLSFVTPVISSLPLRHGDSMVARWLDGNLTANAGGLRLNGRTVPPPDFDFDTLVLPAVSGGYASYQALRMLGRWGVTVVMTDKAGWPVSAFYPEGRNDPKLRLAQMKAALDPTRRLTVAGAFVEAKLGRLPHAPSSLVDLRAMEANAEAERWGSLGVRRQSKIAGALNRRATSPENAAVNYAQAVHLVLARKWIRKVGLDESISFLHSPKRDASSFGYDVQELGRHRVDNIALAFVHEDATGRFETLESWEVRLCRAAGRELALRVLDSLSAVEGRVSDDLRGLGAWLLEPHGTPALRNVPE